MDLKKKVSLQLFFVAFLQITSCFIQKKSVGEIQNGEDLNNENITVTKDIKSKSWSEANVKQKIIDENGSNYVQSKPTRKLPFVSYGIVGQGDVIRNMTQERNKETDGKIERMQKKKKQIEKRSLRTSVVYTERQEKDRKHWQGHKKEENKERIAKENEIRKKESGKAQKGGGLLVIIPYTLGFIFFLVMSVVASIALFRKQAAAKKAKKGNQGTQQQGPGYTGGTVWR